MRKQVTQLQARKGDLKKRNDGLEHELATERVAREAAEREVANQLQQMKLLTVDTTLHARAELIEEFKASK